MCVEKLTQRKSKYKAGPMIQDGVGVSLDELAAREQSPSASRGRRAPGPLIADGQVVDDDNNNDDGVEGRGRQQQQQQQQMRVDKTAMIQDREEAVKDMHKQMETVHSIMQDMAGLIHEQGETLNSIERSAIAMSESVDHGMDDLRVAHSRT